MNILKKPSEYMLVILGLLFNGEPRSSAEIHEALIRRMKPGTHPSRASVINFLKKLNESNHVTFEEQTCQGGYRRVYTLEGDQLDFSMRLGSQMNDQFRKEYLEPLEALA